MDKTIFLPTGYQAPKANNFYMKFQEGENKFRILSQPILGWEDWQDKKPVRYKFNEKPAKSIDPKKPVKHFWAMIVWNYMAEEIQILHITQSTLRKSLEALCLDSDWGAPYFYDIKIIKNGEGIDTEYVLNPLPHKPLSPHIQDLFHERRCNLEALFYNDDPFSKDNTIFTDGIFSRDDAANIAPNKVSDAQAFDLLMILEECEENYKQWIFDYIKKQYNTENLSDLSLEIFERVKTAAVKNMETNHERQRLLSQNEPELLLEQMQ